VKPRLIPALLLLFMAGQALGMPFWGAKTSSPADTSPASLKPGQFVWSPGVAPEGPIVVLVSLTEQRAYVYRNGVAIGFTTVSTGRPGHQTPTGIFTITQKDKNHHSSVYNDAAMPYQERLTWDGVALHAGGLPGYPSSHGCVHLPSEFAEDLFGASHMGMTVVIVDKVTAPEDIVHPAVLAPIDAATGKAEIDPRLQAGEPSRWEPEKSTDGPVSILVSASDRRVIVIRNGIEIGRAAVAIDDPDKPLGTHAFIVKAGQVDGESLLVRGAAARNWMAIPIPGYADAAGRDSALAVARRMHLPQDFARSVYPLLTPGTTLLILDAPVLEENTGTKLTIMGSGNPNQSR
jgi:hypothetical protein